MEVIKFYNSKKEYGELSNFYKHKKGREIVYNNKKYQTSEHLYQALRFDYKGASEDSLEYAEIIRHSSTAYKAKIIANQMILNRYPWQQALSPIIQKYLDRGLTIREDWDDVVDEIMLKVLRLKFDQDEHCQRVLLSTGDVMLMENTSRDCYWASGPDGKGLNMLGILLVKVRNEIRMKQFLFTPIEEENLGDKKENLVNDRNIKEGGEIEVKKMKGFAKLKRKFEDKQNNSPSPSAFSFSPRKMRRIDTEN